MSYRRLHIFPLPIVLMCGCGASPKTTVQSTSPSPAASASSSETKWLYSPTGPSALRARHRLPNGSWLFAAANGERWLSDPRDAVASTSAYLADEDLVAIVRTEPNAFGFIGARGSIFLSDEPLGPFREIRRNAAKFQRIAAAGATLLGILEDGSLVRSSDAGRSLSPVAFPGAHPFDIVVSEDGRALVLSSPEQLWLSNNAGVSFLRANNPPAGVSKLALDSRGNPAAHGLYRNLVFRDRASETLDTSELPLDSQSLELLAEVQHTVSAQGLVDGQASISNGEFVQAVSPDSDGQPWTILRGKFGELASSSSPLAASRDCKSVSVGSHGAYVALACMGSSERKQGAALPAVRLHWSDDHGATFAGKPLGLLGDEHALRLLVLPSGNLLVSGVCRSSGSRCQPKDFYRFTLRRIQPGKLSIAEQKLSELPRIVGRPSAVSASPDGERLYATASLAPSRALGLLISDDQGLTFRAVPLQIVGPQLSATLSNAALLASAQPSSLSVDSDGTLSTTVITPTGSVWLSLDRDGHVLSAAAIDPKLTLLASVGRRAVGLDDMTGELVQSVDHGRKFERIARLPIAEVSVDGRALLWCGREGCAVGRSFTRVGWGKAEGGLPSVATEAAKSASVGVRGSAPTPIVCKATEVMHKVLGESVPISGTELDRGGAIWSTFVVDRKSSSVAMIQATAGAKPKVETIDLLARATSSDYVVTALPQAEGASAMRYSFVRPGHGAPATPFTIRNLELAWINYYDGGAVRKARVAEAGPVTGRDFVSRADGAYRGNPSRLSISGDGIYVCPRRDCNDSDQRLLYVDASGRSHPVRAPEFPDRNVDGARVNGTLGVSRVNGRDVSVMQLSVPGTIAFAREAESPYVVGLLPSAASALNYWYGTTWGYGRAGRTVGLNVTVSKSDGVAFGNFFALDSRTEPVPIPTQADLTEPIKACSPAARREHLRVLAPNVGNPKRAVMIEPLEKDATPKWLHVEGVVMYGNPKDACASVLEARAPNSQQHVVVVMDDMEHSWLVEATDKHVQWQGLSCRLDSNVKAPESNRPRSR